MPTAVRGGTETHWQVFGSGPAPGLALHCGLAHGGMWRGVGAALGARLTLAVPDLPGHGRSGPWQAGRDVHDQATAMARSFFDAPLHLVGHSFGATVALRLALETPGRVLSLALIEPVLFASARLDPGFESFRQEEQAFATLYQTGDHLAAARLFHGRWGSGQDWDGLPEEMRTAMAGNMPFIIGSLPALWHDVHGLLAPGGLEALAAPVTLIRGSESPPVVAAIHHALRDRLRTASEVIIPDAGHMAVATHPEPVARAIATGVDRAD